MRQAERTMGAERRRGGAGHPGRGPSSSVHIPPEDEAVADRTPRLGEPGERNDRVRRVGAAHFRSNRFLSFLLVGHADRNDPKGLKC